MAQTRQDQKFFELFKKLLITVTALKITVIIKYMLLLIACIFRFSGAFKERLPLTLCCCSVGPLFLS
jgi:hypothetical protein